MVRGNLPTLTKAQGPTKKITFPYFHFTACLQCETHTDVDGQFMKGGFLGPMISDVRDYYIDNVRFPTL